MYRTGTAFYLSAISTGSSVVVYANQHIDPIVGIAASLIKYRLHSITPKDTFWRRIIVAFVPAFRFLRVFT
jgi:hypothetical protein